jgi:hypothetical protein
MFKLKEGIPPLDGRMYLVMGANDKMYGKVSWHVVAWDNELEYENYVDQDLNRIQGEFITEGGNIISDIRYWCELPNDENEILIALRKSKIDDIVNE